MRTVNQHHVSFVIALGYSIKIQCSYHYFIASSVILHYACLVYSVAAERFETLEGEIGELINHFIDFAI